MIGTDLGRPIFSDERDPTISDHGYDVLRYFVASRPAAPTEQKRRGGATFDTARRLSKRYRQSLTVR